MIDPFLEPRLLPIALEILDRPWTPEASTAQPPIVCWHSTTQITHGLERRCSLCGTINV